MSQESEKQGFIVTVKGKRYILCRSQQQKIWSFVLLNKGCKTPATPEDPRNGRFPRLTGHLLAEAAMHAGFAQHEVNLDPLLAGMSNTEQADFLRVFRATFQED